MRPVAISNESDAVNAAASRAEARASLTVKELGELFLRWYQATEKGLCKRKPLIKSFQASFVVHRLTAPWLARGGCQHDDCSSEFVASWMSSCREQGCVRSRHQVAA
jgi:hypothetical protein